ncbi:MAG: hypothetical protein COB54_06160 [Alphaproteobacteria bacterium]|nr:MAG: hypothetical protein COB54_06160 [Alphaproteobacteria bacterium]
MVQKIRVFQTIKWVFAGLAILFLGAVLTVFFTFRASLPLLDGTFISSSVAQNIQVDRDKNGNATLTGENRLDLAYATGFIHGQERFFQIDLSRRMAAGEISELFGPLTLNLDKSNRVHRFRARAEKATRDMSDSNRAMLRKYVAGINDGLNNLGSKPFEYWLLQKEPEPWTEEDSFLVIYSMFFALQSGTIDAEMHKYFLSQSLAPKLAEFLLPTKTEWDAPIQADEQPWRPQDIPSRAVLKDHNTTLTFLQTPDNPVPGSNNWAVSGDLTKTGAAMLANDMHLGIRAPATWFRLRLKIRDGSLDISGVSLPGTPLIIAGSNGYVAWGFTNSYVDTSDYVELNLNPLFNQQYLTVDGYKDFVLHREEIKVNGQEPVTLNIQDTIWGPVIDFGTGTSFALNWVAHQPEAVNMGMIRMEQVKTVQQAMATAPDNGIPAQNAMLADRDGNIGWIHFGALPKRIAGDYGLPGDWSTGKLGWQGWLDYDQRPKVYNPEQQRLWSANSRVVSGDDYANVGDGGADIGARQQQIRDGLMRLGKGLVEKDLYEIQLDNRAIFWQRWQQQLLTVLKRSGNPALAPFIPDVENWGGRAIISSVGFRLVKNYRKRVYEAIMGYITAPCGEKFSSCDYKKATHQMESPLWRLVDQRPDGWLPKEFKGNWQAFFEQMALTAWAPVVGGDILLKDYIWGEENRSSIRHPLSTSVPLLGLLTDMPEVMQNGAHEKMPHIAAQVFGQSERIVVSPGHEEDGLMNMPAGQAGHPLSPYYGAGHQDWVAGKMTPFLPGKVKWSLDIMPPK